MNIQQLLPIGLTHRQAIKKEYQEPTKEDRLWGTKQCRRLNILSLSKSTIGISHMTISQRQADNSNNQIITNDRQKY